MMFTLNELMHVLNLNMKDDQKNTSVMITGVEFDSRKIQKGNLFIPLKGKTDGHDYIEQAKKNGAIATLWSKKTKPKAITTLMVEDTLQAMQNIAAYYLKKQSPKIIAITGSNGKTTTKDLTASVLDTTYVTYKTQGNFNNDIGLPYTILHMPNKTQCLVLEMGMDHEGEISFLSQLAKPDIAAITLIGESHLEYFKNRRGIAKAKMEIIDGLKKDGIVIAPGDEPLLKEELKKVKQKTVTFQLASKDTNQSELMAFIDEEDGQQTTFHFNFIKGSYSIPLSGEYNVKNALIAAEIGHLLHVTNENIFKGLNEVRVTKNRSQWLHHNDIDILSDVYNANPTAMKLALLNFSKFKTEKRKVVVLGDMLELGTESQKLHESIKEALDATKIVDVFLYGKEMNALAKVLTKTYSPQHIHYYSLEEKTRLTEDICSYLKPNDQILLKGSHGMHLEKIVERLLLMEK